MSPSPAPGHQRVSKRLFRLLDDYFTATGAGEVFFAPLDVVLSEHDVLVPDIVVAGLDTVVSGRAIESMPLLVVEIVSPFSRQRDRRLKFRRYAELGVPHYWIADPPMRTLECFRLDGRKYVPSAVAPTDSPDVIEVDGFPRLTIDASALFQDRGGR